MIAANTRPSAQPLPPQKLQLRTTLLWLALLVLAAAGIGGSYALREALRSDARTAWQAEASQAAQWLSGTVLGWLEESYAPLSGLAILFENSAEVTKSEFLAAADALEARATTSLLDAKAVARPSFGVDQWSIEFSNEPLGLLTPYTPLGKYPALLETVKVAVDHPDQVTLGPPFAPGDGPRYAPAALAIEDARGPLVVIGLVNFDAIAQGLFDIHELDGLQLQIEARFEESGGPGRRREVIGEPMADALYSATTRTVSAGADLTITWYMNRQFRGGPQEGLADLAFVSGIGSTLFVTLFIGLLVQRNRTIAEKVQAATTELAASEERSRLLLESTHEGIFGVDTHGVVSFVNASAAEQLGYQRQELLGKEAHPLIHYARADGSPYPIEQCPMRAALADGKASQINDDVLWRKDGSSLDVEYTSVPIRKQDEILGAVVVFRDVGEQRRAQEALQKLSRAVEQSSSSVVITDVDGTIEYVNPKFTEVTGYSYDEAVGQTPRILKSGEQSPDFYEDMWQTITSGQEWHGEFRNRKKNGQVYWEIASISPIRDAEGRLTHFVAVRDDVTERKRYEEELRAARVTAESANRAKSDFLANMSHEIRTPMNGIIGMTELALDTELTPEQRDYLNTVKSSADALLSVINDVLDFSKIEAGKLELDPIDFALRDSLADMLNTLANRAHSKGLELAYEVMPEVPDALIGDVYRVRQIIVNLVGNAIKFTQRGEIMVGVEPTERTPEETTLHFFVQDTGIGIPPEKLEGIFQPFSQADVSTTRRYGGTGLGLAICVQLVELMEGRIWAESEAGQGSTFHFTAVLRIGTAMPTADAQESREVLEGLPVLVVDDNATNRRILEGMLGNWRMKPHSVADAGAALAALDRAANAGHPFRVVVSDVNMPDTDGFMLCENVRSNPGHRGMPFIMLTSAVRPGDVARCREVGATSHLLKPVKQSLLMNAIASAVAEQQPLALSREKPREAKVTATTDQALRILLAEDNEVNQKFAVRAINKAGHSVSIANNGREAVDAWAAEQYDVVLMDVQMPEMDGLEATTKIRELEQARASGSRTPIIAMTANAMKGDKERCLAAGMDGYVSKPVKRQTLFAEIARVLEKE